MHPPPPPGTIIYLEEDDDMTNIRKILGITSPTPYGGFCSVIIFNPSAKYFGF